MGKHSFLSASASHRWINCPPSARLCEEYEDRPSEYAQEGTDCHELCAYKVEKALGRSAKDPTENLTYYSQEMEDCADGYCAFVLEEVANARKRCADPLVLVEQRLDYSRYVGIEGSFGTGTASSYRMGFSTSLTTSTGLASWCLRRRTASFPAMRWAPSTCSMASTISRRSALPSTSPAGRTSAHTP